MRVAEPKGTSWSKLIRQILPTKFFLGLFTVAVLVLGVVEHAGAIPSPGARAYKLQGGWAAAPTLASINSTLQDGMATAVFFGETSADDLLKFTLKVNGDPVGEQCVYIDNKNETANPQHETLFVPLNSKKEWEAFKAAGAMGITIVAGCESEIVGKVCATDNETPSTGKDRLGSIHTYSGGQTYINGMPTKTIKMVCAGGSVTTCPKWYEDKAAAVGDCQPLKSCSGQPVGWSTAEANCSANIGTTPHGGKVTLNNGKSGAIGQVEMVCNDGTWLMAGTTAMVGPAGAEQPYDVPGSMTCLPSGSCGGAANVASYTTPASDLCAVGKASVVSYNGSWTWSCTKGLSTTSCSAPYKFDGACGSHNGQLLTGTPSDVCASGNFSGTSWTGSGWTWACYGGGGGSSASCGAAYYSPSVSGSCAPYGSYCSSGTASNPTWNGKGGYYYWNCYGSNGGGDAFCTGT